jgi:hypothetical protein
LRRPYENDAERRQDIAELGRLLREKVEIDRALGSATATTAATAQV